MAARKAQTLLQCGADVTVIAISFSDAMEALIPSLTGALRRPYRKDDAAAFRLVITATGIPEVDGAVYADAENAGVWTNSADDLEHSSFILPAVHRDGAVTIAVSTGGLSPALASWLRTRIGAECGDGLGTLANLLGDARAQLKRAGLRSDSVDWVRLLDGRLPELVRAGQLHDARRHVRAATRSVTDPPAGGSGSPWRRQPDAHNMVRHGGSDNDEAPIVVSPQPTSPFAPVAHPVGRLIFASSTTHRARRRGSAGLGQSSDPWQARQGRGRD